MDQLHTKAGTLGGTAWVLWHVSSPEILSTVILAAIGAVVSFAVSVALKHIVKRFR